MNPEDDENNTPEEAAGNKAQQNAFPELYLLDKPEGFRHHAIALTRIARRDLRIYSTTLDYDCYDNEEFYEEMSRLARYSQFSDIRILIRDHTPLIARNHRILRLARRLSDIIKIRVLTLDLEDIQMGFLLADDSGVLFKPDDQEYLGFANYDDRPQVKLYSDKFDYLWNHGNEHADLKQLSL